MTRRVLGGLFVALALAGCSGNGNTELHWGALKVNVPNGWSGRVVAARGGFTVVHVASFELPANDNDVGEASSRQMARDDLRIAILDYGREAASQPPFETRTTAPLVLGARDLQEQFEHVPRTHAAARRMLTFAGRALDIQIEFGRRPPTAREWQKANAVLATVRRELN